MKVYSALDLQQRTGDIQRAAVSEPVIVTIEEYARLKEASGEPVPQELRRERKAVVRRGTPEDPLGYDTSDFYACAKAMSEAALSGKNRAFVQAEIAAVEKRLMGGGK